MKFPLFNPNENLSQHNFTQYFNPHKMKKIIDSGWNQEYCEEWLFENGIKDIQDAQLHINKIQRASKNGRFKPTFLKTELGRYIYKGSLSLGLLVYPLRHSLCREDYIDFDMINAHYRILEQLCILHKIPKDHFKHISQYCNKREEIRQSLCKQYFPNEEYKTAKDKVKTLFLRIMYLGSFDKWKRECGLDENIKQDAHTSHIQDNIVLLLNRLKQDNLTEWVRIKKNTEKYNEARKKNTDKSGKTFIPKKEDASFLSLFLQSWERKICEVAVEYMVNNNHIKDNTLIYTFDGFMCLKNKLDTVQLCGDLKKTIQDNLHLNISWETKPFDRHIDDIVFPKKQEYQFEEEKLKVLDFQYFNDLLSYEEKRGYFEKFICKTLNPSPIYHFRFTNDDRVAEYKMFNKDMLKEAFMEYNLNENKNSNNKGNNIEPLFIDKWLSDEDKAMFQKSDFIPHSLDPAEVEPKKLIFNTFSGYNPSCFDHNIREDESLLRPFQVILKNIIGGDDDDFEMFNYLMAWKIQKPEFKQPYSVLIKTQEGEGKNTIFDTFGRLFGLTHYYQTTNAEDIFGDHAEAVNHKLLIVLNEMGIQQTKKYTNKFKSLITDPTYNINPKNIRPMTIRNLAMIIVLSNEENPIFIDQTQRDRRWIIYKGNKHNLEISGDQWVKIHKRIRDPSFIKSLYKHYMSYDLTKYNLINGKLRNSRRQAYKSVVCRYIKPEILFLQDYITERRFVGDGKDITHANPLNIKYITNYSSSSTHIQQKYYWKGYEPTQTEKLNDPIDSRVYYSMGFDDNLDWYQDGLFLTTHFQFKSTSLRKDYHTWVGINDFNIERNERSQKAFNNIIPTLNIDMPVVGMKAGEKGYIINPYLLIKSMVSRNYIEIEPEIVKEMDQVYKKWNTKETENNVPSINMTELLGF